MLHRTRSGGVFIACQGSGAMRILSDEGVPVHFLLSFGFTSSFSVTLTDVFSCLSEPHVLLP